MAEENLSQIIVILLILVFAVFVGALLGCAYYEPIIHATGGRMCEEHGLEYKEYNIVDGYFQFVCGNNTKQSIEDGYLVLNNG